MIDIGIDFGSTYTMVTVYRKDKGAPELKSLSEGGAAAIPTVYAENLKKGSKQIGQSAKTAGSATYKKFRAFKMMLGEKDREQLAARGYTGEDTPERITTLFMTELLEQVLARESDKVIHSLVVGAPEVWYDAFATMDGRTKLRDICRGLPQLQSNPNCSVQIVSEPAAASAFFAYNYRKLTGKSFAGNFLLVDYGGGTLDISLTEVEPGMKDTMEIRVMNHAGAGENEEKGEIGCAGIIYMESLAKAAIREALPEIGEIKLDEKFFSTVNSVEQALMNHTADITAIFDEYGYQPKDLEEDLMDDDYYLDAEIYYMGQEVPISYRTMAEVYNKVIRPVFDRSLQQFITYMNSEGLNWSAGNGNNFKVVLVGGFGNFCLVKRQMEETLKIARTGDLRQKDIINSTSDGENAIGLGCGLLAGGAVRIRNTAPIGIGVATKMNDTEQLYTMCYGLKYHQEIEFNKEYIQLAEDGNPQLVMLSAIEEFLVDFGKKPVVLSPKKEFLKLLNPKGKKMLLAYLGFRLDTSGVITLTVHDYETAESVNYELDSYKNLFDQVAIDKERMDFLQRSIKAAEKRRKANG